MEDSQCCVPCATTAGPAATCWALHISEELLRTFYKPSAVLVGRLRSISSYNKPGKTYWYRRDKPVHVVPFLSILSKLPYGFNIKFQCSLWLGPLPACQRSSPAPPTLPLGLDTVAFLLFHILVQLFVSAPRLLHSFSFCRIHSSLPSDPFTCLHLIREALSDML